MLSIAVINYKNPALLRLCLKSIQRTLSPNFSYEILVVDSDSCVETRNVVTEEFSGIKLISFKYNIGYTKGVNEAIGNSTGEYLLILNPDIVILKNTIEKMNKYIDSHSGIGMVGPKLLNFDGTTQNSCFRFYSLLTILYRRSFFGRIPFLKQTLDNFLLKDKDLSKITEVEWLMGSAIMIRREALKKVGIMDERFFLYMSDVDWARRFWENGYGVAYFPESEFYHYHQRTSKGHLGLLDIFFKKETRQHIKDAIKYFNKYGLSRPVYNLNYLSYAK